MTMGPREAAAGVPEAWWDALEDPEGYRLEVVQGELVMTPSPNLVHQRVVGRLWRVLADACPDNYEALSDLEWKLPVAGAVAQAPRPDLLVVPSGIEAVTEAPLLVVEVLSKSDYAKLSTGQTRIEGKRGDYAASEVRDYVEIDLTTQTPEIRGFKLVDGVLRVAWSDTTGAAVNLEEPFPFRLDVLTLVAP